MSIFGVAGSTPSDEGFELKSVRFEDGDAPRLTWTPDDNNTVRTHWTLSCWVKLGVLGTNRDIFSSGHGSSKEFVFGLNTDNQLHVYNYTSGDDYRLKTSAEFRDPSSWYHILCRYESSNLTTADRVQLFINGERQTDLAGNDQPSINFADFWTNNQPHYISQYPLSVANHMDGYLAEAYSIDGSALEPSYFGQTNALTDQWEPKDPALIKQAVTSVSYTHLTLPTKA